MVENPGMETHIHPFEVYKAKDKSSTGLYLHTSPEFHMKEFLSLNPEAKNIYTLTHSFRDEPESDQHRTQFLMLEWYRQNVTYNKIMDDITDLMNFVSQEKVTVQKISISQIFNDLLQVDILNLSDPDQLRKIIHQSFPEVPLPTELMSWDDYFFLLFLNKIEPELEKIPFCILYDYPAQLAALSRLKKSDLRVCERFELYIHGVEIANCFTEETNVEVLKDRFHDQSLEKEKIYKYKLSDPKRFLESMNNYPPSSGIAMGVERLYSALHKKLFFYD